MKQKEIDRLADVITDDLNAPDALKLIEAIEDAPNAICKAIKKSLNDAGFYR